MRSRSSRLGNRLALALTCLGLAAVPTWMMLLPPPPAIRAEPARVPGDASRPYEPVSWELLSGFGYQPPLPEELADRDAEALRERREKVFPEAVRALDGQRVAVRGFFIPAEMRKGKITKFVLAAKNEMGCCFGDGLGMSEWILVDSEAAENVSRDFYGQVTALGTLEVGEDTTEGGYVLSLYRLKAERVVAESS